MENYTAHYNSWAVIFLKDIQYECMEFFKNLLQQSPNALQFGQVAAFVNYSVCKALRVVYRSKRYFNIQLICLLFIKWQHDFTSVIWTR